MSDSAGRSDDVSHADTSSSLARKYNTTVMVSGSSGIDAREHPDNGLVIDDTRFVSSFRVGVEGREGPLVSSDSAADGTSVTLEYDFGDGIMARRNVLVADRRVFEELKFTNSGTTNASLPVRVDYASDFASIFEMRGDRRARRGQVSISQSGGHETIVEYSGLDNKLRKAAFAFSQIPDANAGDSDTGGLTARFTVPVMPGEERTLYFRYGEGDHDMDMPSEPVFREEREKVSRWTQKVRNAGARIEAADAELDRWLGTSGNDLDMLMMETEHGYYPAAGIPWYATQFGRDGIITAMQNLMLNPSMAKGVLSSLADNQAERFDRVTSAEPGKIIHEMRRDEMSMTGEKPFERYYGGADTTMLFIMLAGAYLERTGDVGFIRAMEPNIEAALEWMQKNIAATGFVTYRYDSDGGLLTQFWKDSDGSVPKLDGDWGDRDLPDDFGVSGSLDSVIERANDFLLTKQGFQGQKVQRLHLAKFGISGDEDWKTLPEAERRDALRQAYRTKVMPVDPVASACLQGYAFAALNAAADIRVALGKSDGKELRGEAEGLRQRFAEHFWLPEQGFYSMALDGDKRPCRVKGSDLGHLLFSGIVPEDRAGSIVRHLTGDDMFSGYGIRTMADGQEVAGFDYVSYHNGSVWPHDTAICAAGMARYGYYEEAGRIMNAVGRVAAFTGGRLEELFSGAVAVEGTPPERYHAACAPQAWAAGSAYMLLQAALGLEIGPDGSLQARAGQIPENLNGIKITDMDTGSGRRSYVINRSSDGRPVVSALPPGISACPAPGNDMV